jgi:GGDEF domain-containing protein
VEHVGAKAMAKLLLKDAAEVLSATARATDITGRTGDAGLAAVLIGCKDDGARAFVQRFQGAVGRVTRARPIQVEVDCGIQPLAATTSATAALESAEDAARLVQGHSDA